MTDRQRWPTASTLLSTAFQGTNFPAQYRPAEPPAVSRLAGQTWTHKNKDAYLSIGERIQTMYWSALQYDQDESAWQFTRILGHGSFGIAALYQKWGYNAYALPQIVDELVIKSEQPAKHNAVHPDRIDLGLEAWHLAQLNERQCEANVGLRGYKYLTSHVMLDGVTPFQRRAGEGHHGPPYYREWRYYLEYCPYESLLHLIPKYKAWGYHLPEAFIWFTFQQLIKSCKSMEIDNNRPFRKTDETSFGAPYPDSFMVHGDTKDENFFLGKERVATGQVNMDNVQYPYDSYPQTKFGDFGLARVVQKGSKDSRARSMPIGTVAWMAPEKRDLDEKSSFYPFTEQLPDPAPTGADGSLKDKKSHLIGPEANVWSVGMMMYVLMTLKEIEEVDQEIEFTLNQAASRVVDDQLYMFEFDDGWLEGTDEDYSEELKSLVRECTRVEPHRRPSTDWLAQQVDEGVHREHNRLQMEFGDEMEILNRTRVQYYNHEWNQTQLGPYDHGVYPNQFESLNGEQMTFWDTFWRYCDQFKDPDAPKLLPPGNLLCWDYTPPGCEFVDDSRVLHANWQWARHFHQGQWLHPGGRAVLSIGGKQQLQASQKAGRVQQGHEAGQGIITQQADETGWQDEVDMDMSPGPSPATAFNQGWLMMPPRGHGGQTPLRPGMP